MVTRGLQDPLYSAGTGWNNWSYTREWTRKFHSELVPPTKIAKRSLIQTKLIAQQVPVQEDYRYCSINHQRERLVTELSRELPKIRKAAGLCLHCMRSSDYMGGPCRHES